MPEEQVEIAAFLKIRDQYVADLEKAERDLVRAQEKLAAAKGRLQTANDMIAKATGKEGPTKPLSEEILRIVNEHGRGGPGLSAKDIREKLLGEGLQPELSAIHVNAIRLAKKATIEMAQGPDGRTKLYKPKAIDGHDDSEIPD